MALSISLDELIALNDEIRALVRSGMPLELGLAGWGSDLPGRMGSLVARLAEHMQTGQTLPQALAAEGDRVPPMYQAIVTAGLRSGRLPSALESVATSARSLKDVRAAVFLAVLYPLVLIVVGYLALLLLLVQIVPALALLYDKTPPLYLATMQDWGRWASSSIPVPVPILEDMWIGFVPLVVLLMLVGVWLVGTSRAALVDYGAASRWLRFMPLAGGIVRDARAASLAEVLGLLVEHGVPLDEALELAADCTNDRGLIRSATRSAAALRRGAHDALDSRQLAGFPPLLAWLLASAGRPQGFATMARHVAETYRLRVARNSQWLRDFLPAWLVVAIGGVVLAAVALAFFTPYSELLQTLGGVPNNALQFKP